MEMIDQVREFLADTIGVGERQRVVVAVSGGLDSVVLLDIIDGLSSDLGIQLRIAHLDHQLRPGSASDALFVQNEALRRGWPCTISRADVSKIAREERRSLEEAGRNARYQFLDRVADDEDCDWILLGHHSNDQAETVLLRLLRGSGTTGLAAMRQTRGERILRPLLGFGRSDIYSYAEEKGIDFREDRSNRDTRFRRNRVRAELVPLLERQYNPKIVEILNRTASVLAEEDDYVSGVVAEVAGKVVTRSDARGLVLDTERVLSYHIAIQRRLIRMLLQGLSDREGPFDFARVDAALAVLKGKSGIHDLGGGIRAQRSGVQFFLRLPDEPFVAVDVDVPGSVDIPSKRLSLTVRIEPADRFPGLLPTLGDGRAALDASQLGAKLQVRTVQTGDRLRPLGMGGHKKLSDMLIDAKVPRVLRPDVLLLTRGDQILWVIGMQISHDFRVTESSEEIAVVETASSSNGMS